MQYLSSITPSNKRVLIRLDLDLPQSSDGAFDTTRMEDSFETLCYLWQHKAAHVTAIAHRGHDVKKTKNFSLTPIAKILFEKLLTQKAFKKATPESLAAWLELKENLRFDPREEEASKEFAKELAKGQDLFVNEAFATSHRSHTSIVKVPELLPTVFGFQFEKEMKVLEKITGTPKRPFMFVLGGAKLETKLPLLEKIAELVDVILVGGKLAVEAKARKLEFSDTLRRRMIIADLTEDGFDIDLKATEQFERFVTEAKTLVWNGPMGKYEDVEHREGTKRVAEAIANGNGYKVIGGGDTEAALTILGLDRLKGFDHISSGGGALLHYLAYRSLPGIEAATVKVI